MHANNEANIAALRARRLAIIAESQRIRRNQRIAYVLGAFFIGVLLALATAGNVAQATGHVDWNKMADEGARRTLCANQK